jgi:hypothetical protein
LDVLIGHEAAGAALAEALRAGPCGALVVQ